MNSKQSTLIIKRIIQLLVLISFFSFNQVSAITIKAGVMQTTPVDIVSEWHIGASTQVGEHFSARVVEDLMDPDGTILIPKNSKVVGSVVSASPSKHFRRDAKVDILFEKIVLPDNVQSISIDASGAMIVEKHKELKTAAEGLKKTGIGAFVGAFKSLQFAGIAGSYSSIGTTVAVGAATGGGLALVSFIAQKGKDLDITPGTPMTLNIIALEEQLYKEQKMPELATGVDAEIISFKNNEVKFKITNHKFNEISLNNLKLVDGLGYSFNPLNSGLTKIAPRGTFEFTMQFPHKIEDTRQWLVLTDSFNKREYFRVEVN